MFSRRRGGGADVSSPFAGAWRRLAPCVGVAPPARSPFRVARHASSPTRRSMASWRLRSWLRSSWATTRSTGPTRRSRGTAARRSAPTMRRREGRLYPRRRLLGVLAARSARPGEAQLDLGDGDLHRSGPGSSRRSRRQVCPGTPIGHDTSPVRPYSRGDAGVRRRRSARATTAVTPLPRSCSTSTTSASPWSSATARCTPSWPTRRLAVANCPEFAISIVEDRRPRG